MAKDPHWKGVGCTLLSPIVNTGVGGSCLVNRFLEERGDVFSGQKTLLEGGMLTEEPQGGVIHVLWHGARTVFI